MKAGTRGGGRLVRRRRAPPAAAGDAGALHRRARRRRSIPSSFVTDRLGEISVPTLVLAGELDQVVPLAVHAARGRAHPRSARSSPIPSAATPCAARSAATTPSSSPSWPRATDAMTPEPAGRWALLAALALVVVLALVPWFSAAAVAPLIAVEWRIDGSAGGVPHRGGAGRLRGRRSGPGADGAADVVPPRRLFAGGALARGPRQRRLRALRRRPRHRPAVPGAQRRGHRGRLPGRR